MNGGIIIRNQLERRLDEIELKLINLERELLAYPTGTLSCTSNGKYYKWYYNSPDNHSYIPKSNYGLAQLLANKKYITVQIEDLKKEKKAILTYLKIYDSTPSQLTSFLLHPEFKKLTQNRHVHISEDISNWLSQEYETNPLFPDQLKHESVSGHFLRSKSEASIDACLYLYNIPFRYEARLSLDNEIYYPDFTVKHPRNGKIYYWEHVGLLEDFKYRRSYIKKLSSYISNGIYPSINLIQTFETYDKPFSAVDAEKIIREYFL